MRYVTGAFAVAAIACVATVVAAHAVHAGEISEYAGTSAYFMLVFALASASLDASVSWLRRLGRASQR
jgi:hypothetical protein